MSGITDEQAGEMVGTIEAGNAVHVDACRRYHHAHPPKYGSLRDLLDLSYHPSVEVATIEFHTIAVKMPHERERRYYAGKCSCGKVFYYE